MNMLAHAFVPIVRLLVRLSGRTAGCVVLSRMSLLRSLSQCCRHPCQLTGGITIPPPKPVTLIRIVLGPSAVHLPMQDMWILLEG